MSLPDWYETTLAENLATNPQMWEALGEHGVDEDSELQLEFFYYAPTERRARELLTWLQTETDYNAKVRPRKKGLFSKREWLVTGHTQPTKVSLEILDQWVDWMVTAGAEYGGCEFDGWGAAAP